MRNNYLFLTFGLVIVVGVLFGLNKRLASQTTTASVSSPGPSVGLSTPCKPTFTDGGGPYYQPNQPFRQVLSPPTHSGTVLKVSGNVLKSDCKTIVPNVVLDVWQADESGNYQDEWYRGKIEVNELGEYMFETVVPKGYGEGTAYRPPHIHYKVWDKDRELITSQMFFPDVAGVAGFSEFVLKIEKKTENGKEVQYGQHSIVLP